LNNKLVLFMGVFVLMANAGAQTTAPLVESFAVSGEKTIASKNDSEMGGIAAALRAVGDDGADYVLWNGRIYPMSSPDSTATVEAVAIEDGRIVFVGSKEEAAKLVSGDTKVIELGKKTVLPGFQDSHIHVLQGGMIELECDLRGSKSVQDVLNKLSDYAAQHPEKEWIRASNLPLPAVIGHPPPRDLLDKIIPDRPVYIESDGQHSAWVNSRALEIAEVSENTPEPKTGSIQRRTSSKEPTGVLFEEDGMLLVKNRIPDYTRKEKAASLEFSLKMLNSFGVTSIIEARTEQQDIDAFLDVAERGNLTAHVRFSLYAHLDEGLQAVKDTLALRRKLKSSGLLTKHDIGLDSVKLFVDGTVEEQTAAMEQNYTGQTHRGEIQEEEETVRQMITEFDKAGLQITIHAIGDRGIRVALDGFEQAQKVNGVRDSRHHIVHLHVVNPSDQARFKKLGVTANFQALWASGDDGYVKDINPGLLGPERLDWQYPIGDIVKSGASVVFGSDWPVTTCNPIPCMQVAVTRRGPDRQEKKPWMPEQVIDVATAVKGYTSRGAWLAFRERDIGSLEVGKSADLVILNGDLFRSSKVKLIDIEVERTMFKGHFVYDRAKSRESTNPKE
jgi:predicted amidohydrolase YtcJ